MSALAMLWPNALRVYYSDRNIIAGGNIPKTAISDMEVVSETELASVVSKFIPKLPNTVIPTILVLSEELCFMLSCTNENMEGVKKHLMAITPFTHAMTTVLSIQKQQYVIAVNQDLYESVARAVTKQEHQILLVVPWTLFIQLGYSKGEIDKTTVKRTFDNFNNLRSNAFPLTIGKNEEPVPSVSKQEIVKHSTTYPWGWIVFGGAAFLYASVMYWFFLRSG